MKSFIAHVLTLLFFCFPSAEAQNQIQPNRVQTFTQKVDHFDSNNKATFQQRFEFSPYRSTGPDSPIFFTFCGEYTCAFSGDQAAFNEATLHQGALVVVEHRYYGNSVPFNSLATDHLKFLNVKQALEDFAEIQKYVTTQLNWRGKWIVAGSSYSGMLAADYQLIHPELASGALASSAPVRSVFAAEEMDRHLAATVTPQCLVKVQNMIAEIDRELSDSKLKASVLNTFQMNPSASAIDALDAIVDVTEYYIQQGFKVDFCNHLTQTKTMNETISAYAKMAGPLTIWTDAARSEIPSDYFNKGPNPRSWLWQQCTELGFWNVAYHDATQSVSSPKLDIHYFSSVCERVFGRPAEDHSFALNKQYYQRMLARKPLPIFFTNGGDDPWSMLSLLPQEMKRNSSILSFLTPGFGHGSDIDLNQKNPAFADVIKEKDETVGRWLTNH